LKFCKTKSRQAEAYPTKPLVAPQECGVQPQPPEEDDALEEADPFEDFPALNTESCNV